MTIDAVIELSFIIFLSILLLTIGIQHERNKSLSHEIEDYVEQIDRLHADAIKAQADARQAQIIADRAAAASNQKSNTIMKEKVPHDCEKAIKWAIEESKKI